MKTVVNINLVHMRTKCFRYLKHPTFFNLKNGIVFKLVSKYGEIQKLRKSETMKKLQKFIQLRIG